MNRLILCLRVCDRPIPHVPSVQLTCHTCQQPVWRDAEGDIEAGDEVSCTVCYPHPALEALRAAMEALLGPEPEDFTSKEPPS